MTIDVNFDDLNETAVATDTAPASTDEAPENTAKYPIILTDVPVGEVPEGTESVPAFAERLTRRNLFAEFEATQKGETYDGPKGQVVATSVYQTIKSVRDPLPHVLVKTTTTKDDGTTETAERVYVLVDEALAVWDTRGRGSGGTSARDLDPVQIVLKAGKRRALLAKLEARLETLVAKVEKQKTLVGKSDAQLKEIDKTWDDAVTAHDEWLASQEKDDEKSESDSDDNE